MATKKQPRDPQAVYEREFIMTETPAADIVGELRFLADSRQQMGYDRSGAAMDEAAAEIEALRAREAELQRRIDVAVTALEPFTRQRPHKNEDGESGVLVPATIADIRVAQQFLASIRGETGR